MVEKYSAKKRKRRRRRTLKKRWSQNSSTPGAVLWYVTQLHLSHYFGAKHDY